MRPHLLLAPLLIAAMPAPLGAPAPVQTIDVVEAGRVLATLDDWRAVMLAQMVVIGVLVLLITALIGVIVWLAVKRSANDMATLEVVKENTRAVTGFAASLRALEVIAARRESERAA